MLEKFKDNKDKLVYLILITGFAIDMAFVRNRLGHFALIALIWSILAIRQRQIRLDWGDILLFAGMWIFEWRYNDLFYEGLTYALKVVAVYQIGKYITNPIQTEKKNDAQKESDSFMYTVIAILLLASMMFIKGLLNYSYFLYDRAALKTILFRTGLPKEAWPEWSWTESWSQTVGDVPKTQHEFMLVLMGCMFVYWIYVFRRKKTVGVIGMTLSLEAMFLGVIIRGRMAFCCALCSTIIVLSAYVIERKIYKKKWPWIASGVIAIGVLAIVIGIKLNIAGLNDWYTHSVWPEGGGIFKNVRFELMKQSIFLLKDYPFGRCKVPLIAPNGREYVLAHNSWLDIGRYAGVIPFVLAIGFSITTIRSIGYIWIKSKGIYKYLLISAFCGVMLYHMFEPGIMAGYIMWNTLVFIGGMANGLFGNLTGRKGIIINLG